MFKILALLAILSILFGVEATRQLVFGTFNVVLWVIIAILILWAIFELYDALRDRRTPEEIAEDKARQKEITKASIKAYGSALVFWIKVTIIVALSITALVFIIPQK